MSVYNGEKYLKEAIESILAQTFSDFEYIIINDGSTDHSYGIIQEYATKDKRIKLIQKEKNSGLIDCLNLGLSLARGKYIARMDADDISYSSRFQLQKDFLDNHPEIGLVGSNIHVINSSGKKVSNFINNPNLPKTPEQIYWALCFSCCINHPSIMARLDLMKSAGGYSKKSLYAEDYDLWARMVKITKFYNLPQKLMSLRRHENNVTLLNNDIQLDTRKRVSKDYIISILQKTIPGEMMDFLYSPLPLNLFWSKQIIALYEDVILEIDCTKKVVNEDDIFIRKNAVHNIIEIASRDKTSKEVRDLLIRSARKFHSVEVDRYLLIKFIRNLWKKIKHTN